MEARSVSTARSVSLLNSRSDCPEPSARQSQRRRHKCQHPGRGRQPDVADLFWQWLRGETANSSRSNDCLPACAVTRRRSSSGCKAHPATAPAGSNRGRHGGDEMSESLRRIIGIGPTLGPLGEQLAEFELVKAREAELKPRFAQLANFEREHLEIPADVERQLVV